MEGTNVAIRSFKIAVSAERTRTLSPCSDALGVRDEAVENVGYVSGDAARAGTRRGTVFVKDERSTVFSFGELPADAQRDLAGDGEREYCFQLIIQCIAAENSLPVLLDLFVHAVRAELDEISGFAVLVTSNACYVWNYVR